MKKVKIYGYADSRSVFPKAANPDCPEPLIFIIGNETAEFGNLEQLTLTIGNARKVAKAIIRAVYNVENGADYESQVYLSPHKESRQ